jgi:hypothetical protein
MMVRALTGAVAVLVGVLVPVWGSASASAATGPCSDPQGVTVVVDLTDLDGGVLVGCAGSGEMTGLQALRSAGFAVAGTQREGLAFVCRIDGRPAADERLPVRGAAGYAEQCVDTPPPGAYWGYWTAPPGGPWTYATAGPSAHTAIPGGFEGWRFELNRSQGRPEPPAFSVTSRPVVASSSPRAPTEPAAASPSPSSTTSDAGAPAESTAGPGSPTATLLVLTGTIVLMGGVAAWRRIRRS